MSLPNNKIRRQSKVDVYNKVVKSRKGYIHNNIKRQSEVEASKKTVKSRKEFVLNNNTKKKLKSTVDHQDKGSIESQVLKNIGEQNKK